MTDPQVSPDLIERLTSPDLWLRVNSDGSQVIDGTPVEAAATIERLTKALDYEELAILHGQQVTVTFKHPKDAFDLFNELRDRGSAALNERTDNG